MSDPIQLEDLDIVPALRLELPGMYEEVSVVPVDAEGVRAMFRAAAANTPLAEVTLLPGSDILLPVASLGRHLEHVAEVCAAGVTSIGQAELAGGYAFLARGNYLFGIEDDSTLADTVEWDNLILALHAGGSVRVRHACDQFVTAILNGTTVVLTHGRSTKAYSTDLTILTERLSHAAGELREFAIPFLPVFERRLAGAMRPEHAHYAAYDNFRGRSEWFQPPGDVNI